MGWWKTLGSKAGIAGKSSPSPAGEGNSELSLARRRNLPAVWLCGLFTILSVGMVLGVLLLIAWHAFGYYWPRPIMDITVRSEDGEKRFYGIVVGHQTGINPADPTKRLSQTRLRLANRDLVESEFIWVEDEKLAIKPAPATVGVVERTEYGDAIGNLLELKVEGDHPTTIAPTDPQFLPRLNDEIRRVRERKAKIRRLERELAYLVEPLQKLHAAAAAIRAKPEISDRDRQKLTELEGRIKELERDISPRQREMEEELTRLRQGAERATLTLALADGREVEIPIWKVIRVYLPNQMSLREKVGHYLSKLWEFYTTEPREANTEGGIYPAIVGTVVLVFLMTLAVVPLGVLAAIYLSEYARPNLFTKLLRISINNLAGVPSIVFGMFGLGFFIYTVGGLIDRTFFADQLPTPTFGTGGVLWAALTLALLTIPVVIVAAEESFAAIPQGLREGALALGCTKWQLLRRILLPNALPGILTGVILAVERAAGEVAPLMLVGVVKLAPSLPVDSYPPYLHLERKFMHLGFHIYDVGFQSPNVEAALPVVYLTAFTLIVLVLLLNGVALWLRNRLRRELGGEV